MPSNPKLYIQGEVRFLTISLQRGLPFLPNIFLKNILVSYLAKASNLFPVTICDFLVMGNHIHFMIIVKKPVDLARFLNYFKTNVALALNKLRGIPKGSVWVKGSDSPVILDMESLIKKLAYIYSNPSKANVVSSVYGYNNLHTFDIFRGDKEDVRLKAFNIKRNDIPTLNSRTEQEKDYYKKINKIVFNDKKDIIYLDIHPKKAYEALKETSDLSYDEYKKKVLEEITKNEKESREKRGNAPIKSAVSSMFIDFIPNREKSHKMICICSDVSVRKDFIEKFKYLVNLARECYKKWKKTHTPKYYPVGFFLPSRPPVRERLSLFA